MRLYDIHSEDFFISTDKSKMDVKEIHFFLSNYSTWSKHISYDIVKASIENSLNFGLFYKNKQVGFARVISDFSTIAYLGDFFILPDFQGYGLSKILMNSIVSHSDLQGLRRWILITSSAPWLYEKYGFKKLQNNEIYMEKYDPNVYYH